MHNFFGTDGIRGRMGTGLFTPEKLIQLGNAIAQWAHIKYATDARILLVHDTRISASFVKAALKTGLLQHAVSLEDGGVLPTPACAHLMKERADLHCSIIISASHNPYEDNGIKIMDSLTGKLTHDDEQTISKLFTQTSNSVTAYGTDVTYDQAAHAYCRRIASLFASDFLAGKRIVLDTAHGATYQVAPQIFRSLGAEVITINNKPTGYNINEACGALHTEQLAATVRAEQADIGFAFDGDGDRLIAVNCQGEVRDGDDLLALLTHHPAYAHHTTIVGTSMTNEGFVHYLKQQQKILVRAAVGDKYVAEQLVARHVMLGGEQSGHIILNDIIGTGDGILVALRALEIIIQTNNWRLDTFLHYPQVMMNLPVAARKDLNSAPLANIITQAQQKLATGRVLVRYSGTENLLRVMVETDTKDHAQRVCTRLVEQLSQAL